MVSKTLFSSASDHWETPTRVFESLNKEFCFNFDPCPLHSVFNGLSINWFGNVFVNPPYSDIQNFLNKALEELNAGRISVCVFLVPARTCTRWFHDLVLPNVSEVRFIKGRLKFGNSKNSAPFPSMILVFRKERIKKEKLTLSGCVFL